MQPENTELTAHDLFAPSVEPANTRDRLVLVAMDLFYANGIHAIGLDRVISEVGVTKTTFYNHFESKDELVLEVMRRRDEWEFETWMKMVHQIAGDDPEAQLLAIFDVLHMWFTDERFRGCLFINAAAEFPALHDPAHQAAHAHAERFRSAIVASAEAIGIADSDAFARQFQLLIDGAIVLRQVTGDNLAADAARKNAELLLAYAKSLC